MDLFLNFKTYPAATGKNAEELVHACNRGNVSKLIGCVQVADLFRLSMLARFPLYVQHVDDVEQGRNTGFVTAESAKANGAQGALINHSEHRLKIKEITATILRCKTNGLKTLVCTSSISEAKKIKLAGADYVAYEDPKLIATGIPVTSKPAFVKKFADTLTQVPGQTKLICGAGISKIEDVMKAQELGYDGVLVASAFVLSENHEKWIRDMSEHL